MSQKNKAPSGWQEQQEPMKKIVDTTAYHPYRPVQTCSWTADLQNFLHTLSNSSKFLRGDFLSYSLAVFLSSL